MAAQASAHYKLSIVLASCLAAQAAMAHTPYLLPVSFSITRPHVSLQAGISDDLFFLPEGPVRGDFYAVAPNGSRSKLNSVTVLKDFTVIEADIPDAGTYKLATGDEGARITKLVKLDGRWLMVRQPPAAGDASAPAAAPAPGGASAPQRPAGPPRFIDAAAVPAGVETMETRSFQRLETYVTKGAPSKAALAISGQGFEVRPLTHPNEIFIDQGFAFEALADGQPVKEQKFTVFHGGNAYDEKKVYAEIATDAQGRAQLKFDKPGIYLMTSRYPAASATPAGAAPPPKSYGYTLTFEVFQ